MTRAEWVSSEVKAGASVAVAEAAAALVEALAAHSGSGDEIPWGEFRFEGVFVRERGLWLRFEMGAAALGPR